MELTAEQITAFENGARAMETLKSEIAPLKQKMDAFDAAKYDKIQETIQAALKADDEQKSLIQAAQDEVKNQQTAIDAIKASQVSLEEKNKLLQDFLNRPTTVTTREEKSEDIRQKANKLFNEFARVKSSSERTDLAEYAKDYIKSHEGDLELKALTVNSDPNGGFLTMPEFGGIIETYVYETSPLRRLASVISIGGDTLEYVTDNDQAGWGWVGETQARPDTYTPQLGKLSVTVGEMYAQPNVSQKMLDDAYIDMEAWIAGKVSEVFARGEATAFISGNGINKPKGILAYPSGTNVGSAQIQQVYSGNSTGFTYGGLIALMNALKEPYQNNAVFLTQRGSMAALLGLLDGQNRPIFNMMYDKNAGLENSILGKPVIFAADMPSVATNAVSMAYGDFKKAYQIVDRTGISVLRDPFTNKPFIRFYTLKRVGGAVVNFEAMALLQIHS